MALFTGAIDKIKGVFSTKVHVEPVAIVLTKADGSADIQGSGGNGDALVSLSSASTAALASQATLAAILAQLVTQLARLDLPTKHTAITPHDTNDITAVASKGLQIGGGGNIYYTLVSAPTTPVGPVIVQPGQTLWGQFALVKTTGPTTATNIIGLS